MLLLLRACLSVQAEVVHVLVVRAVLEHGVMGMMLGRAFEARVAERWMWTCLEHGRVVILGV